MLSNLLQLLLKHYSLKPLSTFGLGVEKHTYQVLNQFLLSVTCSILIFISIDNTELENTICFFNLQASSSCILTHTFKFPSLKNEQVAVSDSTRQTVLGDSTWYWILFIGRAGVHRIDQPNRHMHYLLQGPAAAMWHEHGGSLLIRKESQRYFFF